MFFEPLLANVNFMEIIVRTEDRVRIESGSEFNKQKVFADVNSNTYQMGIDITFYEMHRLRLVEKQRTYKMFVIPEKYPIEEFDFGWWSDGNVVWQSF